MGRNERGRFRISGLDVTIEPTVRGEPSKKFDRCLELFEEFCIVTQSVRDGIEVGVSVEPTLVEADEPAPGLEAAEATA